MFESLTRRVLEPPAIGLDISDLTVKFVALKRRGSAAEIEAFGEASIPEGVVVDGEIRREADLANTLAAELRSASGRGVRHRYCVASLPEEKSFVRILELPALKAEDIGPAVRWEVEGVIPLAFDQIYYDFEPMAEGTAPPAHRDVLITAFPRTIIHSYQNVLQAAGFVPLALELESQAISRAVIAPPVGSTSLIIVDIGAVRTSFIIFAGGSLFFTKSIPVGGRDIERAIAEGLKVDPNEARRIKMEVGLESAGSRANIPQLLDPILVRIASELEQQLWFFRDHPKRKYEEFPDIGAVYLCGGDANLTGLVRYLASAVKIPVELANPFMRFALPPGAVPPIPKNESLKYTTAIGLALRASGL